MRAGCESKLVYGPTMCELSYPTSYCVGRMSKPESRAPLGDICDRDPPRSDQINCRLAMTQRGGDPRDAEIGRRVRTLRLQRGLSQTELGSLINVTFQQVQKYEKGTNRISAGRLQRIAEVLTVPVSFFFARF